LNELYKKRRGTSQMSEQFGPNFAPGSFALQQSIRLVYTLRALSRGRNRATRATRDNQDAQTQKEHTHARQRRHNTTASPRLSWPLLLPRRRHRRRRRCCCCCCCCCCAAAVLLLCCCFCCCCFSTRDASRSTTRLNRLFLVLCFYGTHAGASNGTAAAAAVVATAAAAAAEQQQQQVQQQGRPKHTYEYTTRHQAG